MIKENAIAKTELNAIPTIKRIRKRAKQMMVVMSDAVLVLVSVFILLPYLCWLSDKAHIKYFVLQCQFFCLICYSFIHYFFLYVIPVDKSVDNFVTCG